MKGQPVTVFVKDVSFQYALNLLLSTNKLFMKKVSADTIIIIPKSKAKTDQYQDLMVKTFYINNAKSKEIVNLLRSMLDIKKVYVNEMLNSITVRDTPEKMKLVEKVIAANDLKEAEVILDVEILEISRSNSLKYGWNFTPAGLSTSATVQSATPPTSATIPAGSIALSELKNLSKDNVFVTLPGPDGEPDQTGFRRPDPGESAGARAEQQKSQVPRRRQDTDTDLDRPVNGRGRVSADVDL